MFVKKLHPLNGSIVIMAAEEEARQMVDDVCVCVFGYKISLAFTFHCCLLFYLLFSLSFSLTHAFASSANSAQWAEQSRFGDPGS